jgi:SAM-dependent methyltransferase
VGLTREYKNYDDYLSFQKEKTCDPVRREKWLNEEWDLKVQGFKNEFSKLKNLLKEDSKILCLGARTGQEVAAFKEMGYSNTVGIDIVPCEPHVVLGDIHELSFSNNEFDLIYSNIIDHSINPKKMASEIERVLKIDGLFYLQIQLGINQDEFTEFEIKNPMHDVVPLFNRSFCVHIGAINGDGSSNFAGMNFEFVFQKNNNLNALYEKYGPISTVTIPENYQKIWNDINEPIQKNKLDQNNITNLEEREEILKGLSKRAYYLTRLAETFNVKNIVEVGTAEGWQFYSFCEYASDIDGRVFSCDPRDVRNKEYANKFEGITGRFINATSKELAENIMVDGIDMFYIDGLHDKDDVLRDIQNLQKLQNKDKASIWVFDDFDTRFGCFNDILNVCFASQRFKVYKVGLTGSGKDSHQVVIEGGLDVT